MFFLYGAAACCVRIYALLFLNHIHIQIQIQIHIHIHIHIHSANGLQNLQLHNTTMQNYAKSAVALNLYIIITYDGRLCRYFLFARHLLC